MANSTQRQKLKIIQPQEGFQQRFTRSNVDVAFGGGVLNPQPLTSHILTPKGFVSLADLKAGDTVAGIGGEWQTITHCDREGEKDCIRVVLEDGSSAESALDHKWWILKDGQEMTAIGFELLESYQIAKEKGLEYRVWLFRYVNNKPVPVLLKEVIDIGKKEVACVGVSNEDELYITDDYLITKNCGKAQPYSARILTPNGFTHMGSLKEGDIICDTRGLDQTVLRVYEKGVRSVYLVEFDNGRVECCEEHLWTVVDPRTGKEETLTLKELMGRDYRKLAVRCPDPVNYSWANRPALPMAPYTLGRTLSKRTIDSDDLSANMRAKLRLMGIDTEFHIPKEYMVSSIADRKDLLRGLLDEGAVLIEDSMLKYYSIRVYNSFVGDIAELCESLGGKADIVKKDANTTDLHIYMPKTYQYNSAKKHLAFQEKKVNIYRYFTSIEYSRKAQTRCILVSSPNHLYITNDYIPTHNTFAAILMVAEPSLDSLFRGVFTRRNLGNLKAGGGIVDDFRSAYGDYANIKTSENPRIQFPSGAFIDCMHIADESPGKLMERIKGWQYDLAYLDELTSYEFSTFSMIGTRVRGKAQWTGKMRGTTNPKRSHWTRKMLDWYIGLDGFVIPERDGVVRYYYQAGETVDDLVWGDSKEEVYSLCKPDIDRKLAKLGGKSWTYKDMIRSFVFYAGKMSENKASVGNNSSYIGSVAAVGGKRAQQLIEGNFNVDEEEDDKIPISSHDAQMVFTNDEARNGDYWITVDLADVGTDNLVALFWDGLHVEDIMIVSDSTPKMNYERIKMFATRHNVSDRHIVYDATHGTYMYDYMPEAQPFISAGSPIGMYALMSDRLKDECYLRLIDAIANNRISISAKVASTRYVHQGINEEYTVQTEFLEECAVVRMHEKPNGKMKLLTKKEMNALLGKNRSMDVLDPCAMRMYPLLKYQYGEELEMTSIRKNKVSNEGGGTFNIYEDSSWF